MRTPLPLLLAHFLLLPPLAAQAAEGEPSEEEKQRLAKFAADKEALESWRKTYIKGGIRLTIKGLPDRPAIDKIKGLMAKMAKWNNLDAAKLLFRLATVQPKASGDDKAMAKMNFHNELRVWKVRGLARNFIAGMDGAGIEAWLIAKAGKMNAKGDISSPSGAALSILGGRKSAIATRTLLRASRGLQPTQRVRAINSLSRGATLDTVQHFLDLLRDKQPDVRIAAINGLGKALSPHTDAFKHGTTLPAETAKLRDQVISRLASLYGRERIWQVRSAMQANLALLRCKEAIPALIRCLKSELGKKKDPWSLDVRLHRILEGLTGQKMAIGQYKTWELFWKKEGRTFSWKKKTPGKPAPKAGRYEKFFNFELQSDRLLFILDFSGSMAEPVTLTKTGTSSTPKGKTTTKAKLVVEELRKMIMALPDGAMFNMVVFGEDVKVWRSRNDGRPALIKLNEDTRDDLLGSYLDSLHPNGKTNLYGALNKAFDFGGRGLHDKYYQAGFDTLYILSDGAPTAGKVVDTEEILRRVRETNGLKRITINSITFGDKNEMSFLKKLAEQNGGRHHHVD